MALGASTGPNSTRGRGTRACHGAGTQAMTSERPGPGDGAGLAWRPWHCTILAVPSRAPAPRPGPRGRPLRVTEHAEHRPLVPGEEAEGGGCAKAGAGTGHRTQAVTGPRLGRAGRGRAKGAVGPVGAEP